MPAGAARKKLKSVSIKRDNDRQRTGAVVVIVSDIDGDDGGVGDVDSGVDIDGDGGGVAVVSDIDGDGDDGGVGSVDSVVDIDSEGGGVVVDSGVDSEGGGVVVIVGLDIDSDGGGVVVVVGLLRGDAVEVLPEERLLLLRKPDFAAVRLGERARDFAGREVVVVNLADGRDFGGGPADKNFGGAGEVVGREALFNDFASLESGETDDGAPRDAVQEAVRNRSVEFAVDDEEDIRAGGFGEIPAPVEHEGVGEAVRLGVVLGESADHVEAGGFGVHGGGVGRRTPPLRYFERDTLFEEFRREVRGPLPCGDDGIDSGVVGGDAHLPAAAPCGGTDVGVFEVLSFEEFAGDIVEFLDGVRDLEVQDFGGAVEALVVFLQTEDSAVVCALAFEDEAGVVEAVCDGVGLGVTPGDELSIEPDGAVSVVEGDHGAFSGVLVVIFIVAVVVVFIKCVWRCVYVEVEEPRLPLPHGRH